MAPSYDFALFCGEDNETVLGFDEEDDLELSGQISRMSSETKRWNFDEDFWMDFPLQTDECVLLLVESESGHLPRVGYVERLNDLGLGNVRREAVDWICKAHTHYNFGPLSSCLSINYLDRFLSTYEIPAGNTWMAQLLSVACLSLAVKMEETEFPFFVDLKLGFKVRTIKRMELLVMSQLKWRLQATTPFTFIDFFLHKFNGGKTPTKSLFSRSVELILSTVRGTDFIEFRPSELAAAIALSVLGEVQVVDVEQAMSYCIHVSKEAVLKCYEAIQDNIIVRSRTITDANPSVSSVPESPIGVLDVACLSCRSDDITACTHIAFRHGSPESKRRKITRSFHDG